MAEVDGNNEPALLIDKQGDSDKGLNAEVDVDVEPEEHPAYSAQTTTPYLENDDIFEPSSIVPGEVPDLKEDTKIIAKNEEALEDLRNLMADIRTTRGMSQSFAVEAEKISPGFLSDAAPVGYYTKSPTSTRYKASLEALMARVWQFLKDTLEKLVAIAKRVVFWILGIKDQSTKDAVLDRFAKELAQAMAAAMKEIERGLDDIAHDTTNLENGVKHGVILKEGDSTKQFSDIEHILGEVLNDGTHQEGVVLYLMGGDPVLTDTLKDGPLKQAMDDAAGHLLATLVEIKNRARAFAGLLEISMDMGGGDPPADRMEKLNRQLVVRGAHGEKPIREFLADLTAVRNDALQKRQPVPTFKFEELFIKCASGMRAKYWVNYLSYCEQAAMVFVDLIRVYTAGLEKFKEVAPEVERGETRIDFSRALTALSNDMSDLKDATALIEQHMHDVRASLAGVTSFGLSVAGAIEGRLATDEGGMNHEIPAYLKELIEDLKKFRVTLADAMKLKGSVQ